MRIHPFARFVMSARPSEPGERVRLNRDGRPVKRAPGPGRQPKHFAEQQGMAHLLALTEQAVSKTDAEYQERVERHHHALEQRKAGQKQRVEHKKEEKKSAQPSRADIMAQLREKKREKARERRHHRKHREDEAPEAKQRVGTPSILKTSGAKPKKRVSFG